MRAWSNAAFPRSYNYCVVYHGPIDINYLVVTSTLHAARYGPSIKIWAGKQWMTYITYTIVVGCSATQILKTHISYSTSSLGDYKVPRVGR